MITKNDKIKMIRCHNCLRFRKLKNLVRFKNRVVCKTCLLETQAKSR